MRIKVSTVGLISLAHVEANNFNYIHVYCCRNGRVLMGRETTVDYETIPTSTLKEKKVRFAYFVPLGLGRRKLSTPWRDTIKKLQRLETA